jgi:hypothetical protein
MSFAAIALCVASQRVFVDVYFVIDSVRKIFDAPCTLHNKLVCIIHNNSYNRSKTSDFHGDGGSSRHLLSYDTV